MKIEQKKISELKENPDNARCHGEKQINEFVRSVEAFGVIRPIVIDENNVILCGHGLYKALVKLGRQECDVIVEKGLTETQKKKLLLADNKIFSLGSDDFDKIDEMLKSFDGDFDIPGFNKEDLENLYGNTSISEEEPVKYEIPKIEPKEMKRVSVAEPEVVQEGPADFEEPIELEMQQDEENGQYVICPCCGTKIRIE